MGATASQITSITAVNSTVYSGTDKRKTSKLRVTGDRWIPRTNDQYRGKCFHLMTSSCRSDNALCRWADLLTLPSQVFLSFKAMNKRNAINNTLKTDTHKIILSQVIMTAWNGNPSMTRWCFVMVKCENTLLKNSRFARDFRRHDPYVTSIWWLWW